MPALGLKEQRDRFVAFALCAADLLFEVSADLRIHYATGALGLLDMPESGSLLDEPLIDLFVEEDRTLISTALGDLAEEARLVPVLVRLRDGRGGYVGMVLRGYRLANREPPIYLALNLARTVDLQETSDRSRDSQSGLLDQQSFVDVAARTLESAQALDEDIKLTLFGIDGLEQLTGDASQGGIDRTFETLGAVMRAHSFGGDAAGRLDEEHLGLIHDAGINIASVRGELETAAREADARGAGIGVSANTVDLSGEALTPEEAARAVAFTIQRYTSGDGDFEIGSLTEACREMFDETAGDVKRFKAILRDVSVGLAFQPIIDLATGTTHHYECLARFDDGTPPYKWISFAERMGMIEDFDMLVYGQAIARLERDTSPEPLSLAINLSGRSLESDRFVDALLVQLVRDRRLADRLMFEVTESAEIGQLERVNAVVQKIREHGYQIGLDDFGAGAASFQYLHAMTVDFVKIDGSYVRRLLESERDCLMLKAMAGLCRDLGVATVAEMIETVEQALKARELGIEQGQGWLFGKPAADPVPFRAGGTARQDDAALAWSDEGGGARVSA